MAYGSTLDISIDPNKNRKERGAFFTPPELTSFIAEWAIRKPSDHVLEPACGEAEFILAAHDRLYALGCSADRRNSQVLGFELHHESAKQALIRLLSCGYSSPIEVADFLSVDPKARVDVVIGNPPYIRFQVLSAEQQERMQEIAWRSGIALSALSSSWAPFVIHAASFLSVGGRLGFVLPAELLTVNYAAPIRAYLLESFASVQLVTFDKRVFPEVQEEVVVLLADGFGIGSTDRLIWRQCQDMDDLYTGIANDYVPPSPHERWSGIFAPKDAKDSLSLLLGTSFVRLEEWGSISLGAVTGCNSYFAVSARTISEYGLTEEDVLTLSPPGSRHLRRLALDGAALRILEEEGRQTRLFYPREGSLSSGAEEYLAFGESIDVHQAYKCRKRTPWWKVPLTKLPDVFVTYMNAAGPNLCANEAAAYNLNSCHGLVFDPGKRSIGRELLPLACLNSATFLGAELAGRAYGGGILKLEPREAANMPVPSFDTVERCKKELREIKPTVADLLMKKNLDEAICLVDSVLLKEGLEVPTERIARMSSGYDAMRARRKLRGA